MSQQGGESTPSALQRLKAVGVKQTDLFHSQIQSEQTQNLEPDVNYRANIEVKTRKKEELVGTRPRVSSFLDTRSVKPYEGLGKGPDFSQLDQRRAADFYKRQSELKESKIREMTVKANHLYNKLKMYMPEEQIGVDIPVIDDNQKKIKRLENLLRIKNEEVLFKIKIQAANLLAEFQVDKADINGINYLESENEIFEFLMNKLKLKLKDIKNREKQNGEWRSKDKQQQERNEQTIHFLTQTNQIVKNSQARTKQKLEEIKHQWALACEKVSDRDRIIEERDNEVFKLKKLYQDLQGQHLRISANQRQLTLQLDNQKRESDLSLKQMRNLLQTYNLEKKHMQSMLQEKDSIIEEMDIKEKFAMEEFEKVNREYVRWKERYEWLQKEKQGKMLSYQQELDKLVIQFESYKNEFNSQELSRVKNELEITHKELVQERAFATKYEEELQYMSDTRVDLEQAYYKKVETLESEYVKKYQNFEQVKQKHIEQVVRLRQQAETAKIQELEVKWKKKLDEQEGYLKTKVAQIEQLNTEKFSEKQHQIVLLKEQITQLQDKLAEKDKLITVLYPKITTTSPEQ